MQFLKVSADITEPFLDLHATANITHKRLLVEKQK